MRCNLENAVRLAPSPPLSFFARLNLTTTRPSTTNKRWWVKFGIQTPKK